MATHCALKLARSAMPPETIAGTAAANVQRKKKRTSVWPCAPNGAAPPEITSAEWRKCTPYASQ